MGLSQKDQTKHNTLLRLGTQSIKKLYSPRKWQKTIFGVRVPFEENLIHIIQK